MWEVDKGDLDHVLRRLSIPTTEASCEEIERESTLAFPVQAPAEFFFPPAPLHLPCALRQMRAWTPARRAVGGSRGTLRARAAPCLARPVPGGGHGRQLAGRPDDDPGRRADRQLQGRVLLQAPRASIALVFRYEICIFLGPAPRISHAPESSDPNLVSISTEREDRTPHLFCCFAELMPRLLGSVWWHSYPRVGGSVEGWVL